MKTVLKLIRAFEKSTCCSLTLDQLQLKAVFNVVVHMPQQLIDK